MTVRPLDAAEIATIRGQVALGKPTTEIAHQLRVPLQLVEAYVTANLVPKSVAELQAAREHTERVRAERRRLQTMDAPPAQPTMRDLLRPPSIPKRSDVDMARCTYINR